MEGRMNLPQEEVDAIIRHKRKAREPKACYACHKRKVRCDRNLPCNSCVLREHPELCSYERPSKRRQLNAGHSHSKNEYQRRPDSPNVSPNTSPIFSPKLQDTPVSICKTELDGLHDEIQRLKKTVSALQAGIDDSSAVDKAVEGESNPTGEDAEREGIHTQSGQMATVHLGSRSVLAYMMGLQRSQSSRNAAKTLLEENILPKLGLDNETATYPFVDLWGTEPSTFDVQGLVKALPDDEHCRKFFTFYRNIAGIIYPVIADAVSFETDLNKLLTNRALSGGVHVSSSDGVERPFGMSLSWLGLLFAVLASGSQSSNLPSKERELTSQVYICCAYQALRMTNFMTHPSVETIQAFLVIGNVLSFNMNPGVSYILLGMTVRIAFSMGLQTECHHFAPAEQYLRRHVWWALAWQDSHFSISYDRPSSTTLCGTEIPYRQNSRPGHRSYPESMMRIIKLTQELVRGRILMSKASTTIPQIVAYKDEVARIVADGEIHLRDRSQCFNQTQHVQRLALKLHSTYITSELCRPALRSVPSSSKNELATGLSSVHGYKAFVSHGDLATAQLRQECLLNLKRVIKAYLECTSICYEAARSWIAIQRAISAAFLLVVQEESLQDPNVHALLRDLEAVISERTRIERTFCDTRDLHPLTPGESTTDHGVQSPGSRNIDQDLSGPPYWARSMTKSLNALGKLNAALASPANGGVSPHPGVYGQCGPLPPIDHEGKIMDVRSDPRAAVGSLGSILESETGAADKTLPITPESTGTSGGEWNVCNIAERAGEFVQPALWN